MTNAVAGDATIAVSWMSNIWSLSIRYWSVFRLHALEAPAVALMGRTIQLDRLADVALGVLERFQPPPFARRFGMPPGLETRGTPGRTRTSTSLRTTDFESLRESFWLWL